jgi:hypothetical protein
MCRLRQLIREAKQLPSNKAALHIPRITRLQTAIEGTLAAGTLDVVQVHTRQYERARARERGSRQYDVSATAPERHLRALGE